MTMMTRHRGYKIVLQYHGSYIEDGYTGYRENVDSLEEAIETIDEIEAQREQMCRGPYAPNMCM